MEEVTDPAIWGTEVWAPAIDLPGPHDIAAMIAKSMEGDIERRIMGGMAPEE